MIGVIGGNGVAATNLLCQLVEDKVTRRGAFRDAHHPEMLIWQATQVPSRSMYLEGRGPSFIEGYVEIAKRMKDCGCDYGCICCNTAHYALETIQRESGLPFVSIIDEVAHAAKKSGLSSFELFASDGCIKTDLYRKSFSSICPNVELIYPSPERQALVTKVICNVKNHFRYESLDHSENPTRILMHLLASAAAPVILGCTDLSMLRVGLQAGAYALDSLQCLADAIVHREQAS